jgi:hypothetical protein
MASTYLTRTPSLAGNRKTFTLSMWVKTSNTSFQYLAGSINGGGNYSHIGFTGNTTVRFFQNSPNAVNVETNQLLRDPSAWYHIVYSVDTTQATSADRIKIYVNGTEATYASTTYPSQNLDMNFNEGSVAQGIGCRGDLSGAFNGSMAHVHFTDGTAYDASTFGETDATTGIWKPKTAPSVTYGTNGFFLKFENSGAFGTDSSGNANNFTVNGTMTQTIDTPSNVFATLNSLNGVHYAGLGFSNGNNSITTTAGQYAPGLSTLGVSTGKWYGEFKMTSSSNWSMVGVTGQVATATDYSIGHGTTGYGYTGGSSASGQQSNNNSLSSYGDTYNNGDIIGIALDLDNNKLYFSKNGTWQNSGDPTSGATGTGAISISASPDTGFYHMGAGNYSGTQTPSWSANFGNGFFGTTAVSSAENPDDGIGIFEYDVPTGYKSLCTKSINAQEYD